MLRFYLAQVNPIVGDLKGNCQLIIDNVQLAKKQSAQVVIFPELMLTGYMPEDMLLRKAFIESVQDAREYLRLALKDTSLWALLGYPCPHEGQLKNALGVLHAGKWVCEYHKQCLPNDSVFDEKRYFHAGSAPAVCDINGVIVGLSICEDMWHSQPMIALAQQGAHLLINISASPFTREKPLDRLHHARIRAQETSLPLLYANLLGGQDELVFDGGSFAIDKAGQIVMQAPRFQSGGYLVDVSPTDAGVELRSSHNTPELDSVEMVYQALLLSLKDYVRKNHFKHALLGLSGGIDSALSLVIAVDALGADAVTAVFMPSCYTSDLSERLVKTQTDSMGVKRINISIDDLRKQFEHVLTPIFDGLSADATEENLQARCRGVLLMALSNKLGGLLLTTGNKSEVAVGYATLYGDMAGGFNPLKDIPKTMVYDLARWRNGRKTVIPQEVIERPPSAELRPDQKDSDMLPSYEILDEIIERYVEQNQSAHEIIATGMDTDTVHAVVGRLNANEYKRQQSAIGTRISTCSFSRRDRRYPVSSKWTEV